MSRMSTAASAPDGGASPGGRPAPGRGRRLVRRVARVVVKLFLVVTIASLTFNALVRPPQTAAGEHGRLLAAIRAGDVDGAAALARAHALA